MMIPAVVEPGCLVYPTRSHAGLSGCGSTHGSGFAVASHRCCLLIVLQTTPPPGTVRRHIYIIAPAAKKCLRSTAKQERFAQIAIWLPCTVVYLSHMVVPMGRSQMVVLENPEGLHLMAHVGPGQQVIAAPRNQGIGSAQSWMGPH